MKNRKRRSVSRRSPSTVAKSRMTRLQLEMLEDRRMLSGDGLTGLYYNNADLTGSSVCRVDGQVNYTWTANQSPTCAERMAADDVYSVRWTGKAQPQYSENYTFYVSTDAGVRLYINGKNIIDQKSNVTSQEFISTSISLVANQLSDVTLEYYNNTGSPAGGQVALKWSSANTPKNPIPQSNLYSMTALHAVGNQVQATDGRTVVLQGVNDAGGLTTSATAPQHLLEAAGVATDLWGANALRILVSEDAWFGYRTGQTDGGTAYRQLIDSYISVANERGVYVLLCLGSTNAGVWGATNTYAGNHALPDDHSTEFWADAATRYKSDPYVVFDLFNEPRILQYPAWESVWGLWQNGGTVNESTLGDYAALGSPARYHSPGMQGLINTVRAQGAMNMVVAGGEFYARNLTGLPAHALQDTAGNGVLYSVHLSPTDDPISAWDSTFGNVVATYPVIAGAIGNSDSSQQAWGTAAMDYIQAKGLGWLSWSENLGWMVSDWDHYTPTSYWGQIALDRMNALYATSFERYTSGSYMPNGDGWTISPTNTPTITTSTINPYSQVMWVTTPHSGYSDNYQRIAPAESPITTGTLVVDFDVKLNKTDSKTLLMIIGGEGSQPNDPNLTDCASYIYWGYALSGDQNRISINTGSTDPLKRYVSLAALTDSTTFHHVEVTLYVDGSKAHTLDLAIDGVVVANNVAWTNTNVAGLTKVHFVGAEDTTDSNEGFCLDNVSIRNLHPLCTYTTGGFENTTTYPTGAMTDGEGGWKLGSTTPKSAIVASGGYPSRCMELYTQTGGVSGNNALMLPTDASRGTLMLGFDVQVTSTTATTLTLRIGDETVFDVGGGNNCAAYLQWNSNGQVRLLQNPGASQTWTNLAPSTTSWQHVDLTLYLDGPKAETLDVTITSDGNKVVVPDLAWTKNLSLATNPLRYMNFMTTCGGPATSFRLDNVAHRMDATPLSPQPTAVAQYLVDDDFSGVFTNKPSGWDVSLPQATFSGGGLLNEIATSNSEGSSLKKRFVEQTSGVLTWEFCFTLINGQWSNADPLAFELRNNADDTAIRIFTEQNSLYCNTPIGNVLLCNNYNALNVGYCIKVEADLNNHTFTICFNGLQKASGVPFLNNVENLNTVFIHTPPNTTTDRQIQIRYVKIYTGYLVNERCLSTPAYGVLPDWTTTSATVQGYVCSDPDDVKSLKLLAGSNAVKTFAASSTSVVVEHKFLLTASSNGTLWDLRSGSTTVALRLQIVGTDLCYQSGSTFVTLVPNCRLNLWYSIKIVYSLTNPTDNRADIYVNGKIKATGVATTNNVNSVDRVAFWTPSATMWLDDILVYPFLPEPPDYVPAPHYIDDANYLVGMQACSMWRDGTVIGWDAVSGYPSRVSLLGTYDEGNPEVADWEIKWMREHGVDFEQFCWFRPWGAEGNPIKEPSPLGSALNEGYFYAKYRDDLKFTIMWETANSHVASVDDVVNNVIPYFVEYYFKDPQYLKIDGKPVLSIFSLDGLKNDMPGPADDPYLYAREALGALQAACQAEFGGIILLASTNASVDNTANDTANDALFTNLAACGFDYTHAYSWGHPTGDVVQTQEGRIQGQQRLASAHGLSEIPVMTMGFDYSPWVPQQPDAAGGYLTSSQFQALGDWVKNQFMAHADPSRNMVLLDAWNEYGEGHFLLPTPMEGFGYLDAVKAIFNADGLADETPPTSAQKHRLDVLHLPDRMVQIPGNNLLSIKPGFESGAITLGASVADNTSAHGCNATLTLNTTNPTYVHSGVQSLKVEKTTATGSANFHVTLLNQCVYNVSAWARLDSTAGSYGQHLNAFVQYTLDDGTIVKKQLGASGVLSTTAWTELTCTYTLYDVRGVHNTQIYFSTDGTPAQIETFYLDDAVVSKVDNLIINGNAEQTFNYPTYYVQPGVTAVATTNEKYHGVASFSATFSPDHPNDYVVFPVKYVEKSRAYTVSGALKLPGTGTDTNTISVGVRYFLADGTTAYDDWEGNDGAWGGANTPISVSQVEWTSFSKQFTIGGTAKAEASGYISYVRLIFKTTNTPLVAFLLDDIDVRLQQSSLLNDPGFESAYDTTLAVPPQITSSNATLSIDSVHHDGARSLKAVQTQSSGYAQFNVPFENQKTYNYSFWINVSSARYVKVAYTYKRDNDPASYSPAIVKTQSLTAGWTQITGTFSLDSLHGLHDTGLQIYVDGVATTFYIDQLLIW